MVGHIKEERPGVTVEDADTVGRRCLILGLFIGWASAMIVVAITLLVT